MSTVARDQKICVIGLGHMGSALAQAASNAGYRVSVWNRTRAKCDALTGSGATVYDSVAEAVRQSDIAVACLIDHEAARESIVNEEVGRALGGKLLVQLGTMNAHESQEAAAWAASRSIAYLEGSIIGFPSDVTLGTAMIAYAGARNVFDRNAEFLAALGGAARLVGEEIGAAVTFDKTYYSFAYAMMIFFMHGAAMAYARGFPVDAFLDTVVVRLPTMPRKFKWFTDMMVSRCHDDVQASLAVHAAAFAGTLNLCRETGVDDALPAAMTRALEGAIAEGYGEREISAMFEYFLCKRR